MRASEVKKLSNFERLVYWITEREKVRLARTPSPMVGQDPTQLQSLPLPWTDDEILQRYRFCNVVRVEDRVSQWLLNHWYLPNKNHPNMLIACTIARFFNLPISLELIGFPLEYQPEELKAKLRARKQEGSSIFNAAYMVRGNDGVDKVATVIDYTVTPLYHSGLKVDSTSLRKTWEVIYPFHGFGSFMAGQVAADLRWALDGAWADAKIWAPLGPGSRRGMNRLLGYPRGRPSTQAIFLKRLRVLMEQLSLVLPPELFNRMEAIDAQNCLCEFDKYTRVMLGEGRPKQRYPGVE